MTGQAIILQRYPDGAPGIDDFALREMAPPAIGEGEVLVAVSHLSMDPFPRLRMQARSPAGSPMVLGEVVEGRGIGRVLQSRHPGIEEGDWVLGEPGWRTHAVMPGHSVEQIDPSIGVPRQWLGVLGPSGLTAWFVTNGLGKPAPGEQVLIAPAAGSVGTIAGQLARLSGAHTIGIGSAAQAGALTGALGYDAAVDYRALPESLARACPNGVDLFIDGVGGVMHDAVLPLLNPRARIVLLGFISGYNEPGLPHYGAAPPILMKRARMEGFLLADWRAEFREARAALAALVDGGDLMPVETIWRGLDQAPQAFAALFGDAAPGKHIVSLMEGQADE